MILRHPSFLIVCKVAFDVSSCLCSLEKTGHPKPCGDFVFEQKIHLWIVKQRCQSSENGNGRKLNLSEIYRRSIWVMLLVGWRVL